MTLNDLPDFYKDLRERASNGDETAQNILLAAAGSNDNTAKYTIASMMCRVQDFTDAYTVVCQILDEAGNSAPLINIFASFALGQLLFNGLGCNQDVQQGMQFIKIAADQGLAEAQGMFGCILITSFQDMNEGMRYLEMAVSQGDPTSINFLQQLNANQFGGGFPPNPFGGGFPPNPFGGGFPPNPFGG